MEDQDPAFPNYATHAADARYWLAGAEGSYDVIGMDAYHQPYIPFHLTTVEFFREVKARLGAEGSLLRRVRVWEAPGCSASYQE